MSTINVNRGRIVNYRLRSRHFPPVNSTTEREEIRYAGFWMRVWAYALDIITVASIGGLLISPLVHFFELNHPYVQTVLSALVFFVYFAFMTKKYGQTVGKMVLGLKVISKSETLTWGQVFFREGIGRLLHQIFPILYLLYIVVAFTSKKEGLHDMIADTYVVHE